ncbi:hypothetical protein GCM10010912_68890 [Paenibacillus albidus]|uniref:Uncharacterized protein n=1 Tax=Paenibacillus albidus TaxID=2041023 RepID=A0A917LDF4_9BACL|nr:hypothetical protein GCM10010912_68890 [Paenibacillus albidus]
MGWSRVGLGLVVAVLWGLFGSPQAVCPLPSGLHFVMETLLFGLPVLLMQLWDQ